MTPARPDTCLFLAFDEVTNVRLISESHECRMGMLEQNENDHRTTAMGFLMKLLSPTAKVTHFLFLSLFLPPLADTAAPNSSQGSICINLIKMTKIIGVDSCVPPNH